MTLIVVKIGTNSVIGNVAKICKDIAKVKAAGVDVILVSSGAVGMGRGIVPNLTSLPVEKQILASIGQIELMEAYKQNLLPYSLHACQILITKKNIESKQEMANLEGMLRKILSYKNMLPVINENDSISLQELMFTDNDEIAAMLTAVLGADKLIILTNVDGLYDDFFSAERKIISQAYINELPQITEQKSTMGRGGMQSKIAVATKLAKLGIGTTIANVVVDDVLNKIVIEKQSVGTAILPQKNSKTDKSRRRLAFETGLKTFGKIFINQCLEEKIANTDPAHSSAFSILPVGIVDLEGTFKKNDLVEIYSFTKNTLLGYCLAGYDFKTLQPLLTKPNSRPFARYEYIYFI